VISEEPFAFNRSITSELHVEFIRASHNWVWDLGATKASQEEALIVGPIVDGNVVVRTFLVRFQLELSEGLERSKNQFQYQKGR
jgi:hypothetical protein